MSNEQHAEAGAVQGVTLVGKGKKRIGCLSFHDREGLVHIEIAPSVLEIGYSAFEGCVNLESVVIPPSVKTIERSVFSGCAKLTKVVLPKGVETIGEHVFSDCANLKELVVASTVKVIDTDAFRGCRELRTIKFEDGSVLQEVGCAAFRGCKKLEAIEIPESVQVLGQAAFEDCTALASVKFPREMKSLGGSSFEGCTGLTAVELPGVSTIQSHAFRNCAGLRHVVVKVGVEVIGEGAFGGCAALESVDLPRGLKKLERGAFEGCTSLASLDIPETVTEVGRECFENCEKLRHVVARTGVEVIRARAFYRCGALKDIDLPSGLKEIQEGAFKGCASLVSVDIPETVTEIGRECFAYCGELLHVVAKASAEANGVVRIGSMAFEGCRSLKSVTLPRNVTRIPWAAFQMCGRLAEINSAGVSVDSTRPFALPASVEIIEKGAFYGCAFTRVDIPEGVKEIGSRGFAACEALTEVTLASSVNSVGAKAFDRCGALSKVTVAYGAFQKEHSRSDGGSGSADGGAVRVVELSGCEIAQAVIPDYLANRVDLMFTRRIPPTLLLVDKEGGTRPWVWEEDEESRAFFSKYGIHLHDIWYEHEAARDFYAGCRMYSPERTEMSVEIPEALRGGDVRCLVAKFLRQGGTKTYEVLEKSTGEAVESYALQRDAKTSKYWNVFAALTAYGRRRERQTK